MQALRHELSCKQASKEIIDPVSFFSLSFFFFFFFFLFFYFETETASIKTNKNLWRPKFWNIVKICIRSLSNIII